MMRLVDIAAISYYYCILANGKHISLYLQQEAALFVTVVVAH